jgi:ATP phosphoribosyltransferase regulatory subunit
VPANPAAVLDPRVPFKAGAEIFGAESLSADAEVIALLVDVLAAAGIDRPVLVLGHMGIYQGLVDAMALSPDRARGLFEAVQSKSETDIATLLKDHPYGGMAQRLPTLMGRRDVLNEARTALADAPAEVAAAIDALERLADLVRARCPDVELRFDVAELAGYGYHNGPVFSAYEADRGSAIARGGRYDGVGAAFGRSRPATGFDVSLKRLVRAAAAESAIWAPWIEEPARRRTLLMALTRLRSAGEIVVSAVSAEEQPPVRCDRTLIEADGGWTVRPRT